MRPVYLLVGMLTGLDLSVCIQHDGSSVSALSAGRGDRGHITNADILLTYELSPGGSVHQVQPEAAHVAAASAASNMRRQKLGAVTVVARESGTQNGLANGLRSLLAGPNKEDVKKACKHARAMMAARRLLSRSPTIDTAMLIARHIARNISAETLAAEADPCAALEDKLGAPMEGHVIVISPQHGGGKVEVPLETTPAPLTAEEQQMRRAFWIFIGGCISVGVCMIGIFAAAVYILNRNKIAAKLAAVAERGGSVRKSKFQHSPLKEADEPFSDNAEGERQILEPIPACEAASAGAESEQLPDF